VIQSLTSPAFVDTRPIPARHTADGPDVSPEVRWSGLPKGTVEVALIVDDPDAPSGDPWVHWLIYKIPAATLSLPEGVGKEPKLALPAGALQGKNSFGSVGYRGPAPPDGHGLHHYHFKLYALDAPLEIGPGIDKKTLLEAMSGHVLSHRELVGTYKR
jgi:Raf kinase inhibitor-like YbhB/YbcL family protein